MHHSFVSAAQMVRFTHATTTNRARSRNRATPRKEILECHFSIFFLDNILMSWQRPSTLRASLVFPMAQVIRAGRAEATSPADQAAEGEGSER